MEAPILLVMRKLAIAAWLAALAAYTLAAALVIGAELDYREALRQQKRKTPAAR